MLSRGERDRPAWRDLKPGDPWTFITADPIRMGVGGDVAMAGNVIEWQPEDGPPLLFHIREFGFVDRAVKRFAYSCTHIPQPPAFREQGL